MLLITVYGIALAMCLVSSVIMMILNLRHERKFDETVSGLAEMQRTHRAEIQEMMARAQADEAVAQADETITQIGEVTLEIEVEETK